MANNRICLVCGKAYEYCGSCDGKRLPIWMNLYHDENCRQIFNAVNDYNHGLATKEQSRERLSACNLNMDIKDSIQKVINELMASEEPKPAEETDKNTVETIVESSTSEKPVRRTGRKKMTVISE